MLFEALSWGLAENMHARTILGLYGCTRQVVCLAILCVQTVFQKLHGNDHQFLPRGVRGLDDDRIFCPRWTAGDVETSSSRQFFEYHYAHNVPTKLSSLFRLGALCLTAKDRVASRTCDNVSANGWNCGADVNVILRFSDGLLYHFMSLFPKFMGVFECQISAHHVHTWCQTP